MNLIINKGTYAVNDFHQEARRRELKPPLHKYASR